MKDGYLLFKKINNKEYSTKKKTSVFYSNKHHNIKTINYPQQSGLINNLSNISLNFISLPKVNPNVIPKTSKFQHKSFHFNQVSKATSTNTYSLIDNSIKNEYLKIFKHDLYFYHRPTKQVDKHYKTIDINYISFNNEERLNSFYNLFNSKLKEKTYMIVNQINKKKEMAVNDTNLIDSICNKVYKKVLFTSDVNSLLYEEYVFGCLNQEILDYLRKGGEIKRIMKDLKVSINNIDNNNNKKNRRSSNIFISNDTDEFGDENYIIRNKNQSLNKITIYSNVIKSTPNDFKNILKSEESEQISCLTENDSIDFNQIKRVNKMKQILNINEISSSNDLISISHKINNQKNEKHGKIEKEVHNIIPNDTEEYFNNTKKFEERRMLKKIERNQKASKDKVENNADDFNPEKIESFQIKKELNQELRDFNDKKEKTKIHNKTNFKFKDYIRSKTWPPTKDTKTKHKIIKKSKETKKVVNIDSNTLIKIDNNPISNIKVFDDNTNNNDKYKESTNIIINKHDYNNLSKSNLKTKEETIFDNDNENINRIQNNSSFSSISKISEKIKILDFIKPIECNSNENINKINKVSFSTIKNESYISDISNKSKQIIKEPSISKNYNNIEVKKSLSKKSLYIESSKQLDNKISSNNSNSIKNNQLTQPLRKSTVVSFKSIISKKNNVINNDQIPEPIKEIIGLTNNKKNMMISIQSRDTKNQLLRKDSTIKVVDTKHNIIKSPGKEIISILKDTNSPKKVRKKISSIDFILQNVNDSIKDNLNDSEHHDLNNSKIEIKKNSSVQNLTKRNTMLSINTPKVEVLSISRKTSNIFTFDEVKKDEILERMLSKKEVKNKLLSSKLLRVSNFLKLTNDEKEVDKIKASDESISVDVFKPVSHEEMKKIKENLDYFEQLNLQMKDLEANPEIARALLNEIELEKTALKEGVLKITKLLKDLESNPINEEDRKKLDLLVSLIIILLESTYR